MASDPITWRNMRPISIADELMAYAKYSGGAGDALKGMGTSIDDMLQRKSTRDTEAFLAGADALPTAEARNAALQQAREGFNLINVGKVRKGLRATELHDFARTQREEQAAQAADLLLTQKSKRDDIIADNLRADKRNKQLMINEANEAAYRNEQIAQKYQELSTAEEQFEREQAFKEEQEKSKIISQIKDRETQTEGFERADKRAEDELEFDREKWELEEKIRLENEPFRIADRKNKLAELEEKNRVRINKGSIRKDLKQIALTKDNYTNTVLTDANGKRILPEIAEFNELTNVIQNRKDQGFSNETLKPLTDKYDKLLADDRTIRITQEDLDAAFGVDNPPDYTDAGKLKLKDALFSRITADYVHATTDAAETKATNVINKSKYAAKYANPLIASFDKMEAVAKPDPKTGAVNSEKVLSTYFKQRKYIADNWPDQLDEFDGEWKDSALNATTVSVDIASLKKTKLTNKDGTLKLDTEGNAKYSKTFESIIKKPNDQITRTDLARYDKSIKQQLIKLGFRNLTPAEIAIVTKNSEAGIPGLEDKITSLRALHAAKLKISTGEVEETVAQTLQPSQVETKVNEATQTLITTANHQRNAVVPTQQAYMKYLKESGKDNGIEGTDLDNAIRRLDDILISRAPTLKAGERAHILMNFMKAHSSVQTWTLTPDVIIDFDENGLIETAPAGLGDRQVIDIESKADTNKAFRMMMEKTGLYTYPAKAQAALELMYGNQKANNDNIIKDNNMLLDQLSDSKIFGKTPAGVQAQIDKLKKQIAEATRQNAFLERSKKERGGK